MAGALPRGDCGVVRGNRWFEALYSRLVLKTPALHAALVSILLPDTEHTVELFGARLLINQRRDAGYWRAQRAARSSAVLSHEAGSLVTLALLLQPGDTFVDVGANVGLYAASYARLLRIEPQLRIHAFEANPDTARRLQTALACSGVAVHCYALSDHDGELAFVEGSTSLTFGVAGADGDLQLRNRVHVLPARRLDGVGIAGDSIVLKIDVENHEREVLDGAEGLFAAGRVKAVYLDGFRDAEIPERLRRRGFELLDGLTLTPGPAPTLLALRR